jgi:class 3 adenylate cyclase
MAQRNELIYPSQLALAASFLPAPLRRRYAADPTKISLPAAHGSYAALLWTDIVGFTPLSNRLVERGPNGVEKLSQLLRSHYGPLLATITAHCGEPIMVSGDGLLAMWPCDADGLGEALLRAAACGEAVLSLDAVIDDWGQPITNHVVVACGACRTVEIGGFEGQWLFLPIGAALDDLKVATSQVTPRHVLLSPMAVVVGGANLSVVPLDHGCARLVALNRLPAKRALQLAVPGVAAFEAIRAYVPSPVAVRLSFGHLEWMADLRRVTVVFLRLLDLDHAADEALEKLHHSLSAIQPIVHRHDGVINQVCVHDKGVTIVIYFGAPPVAHSDDPARGVRTALDLQAMLLEVGRRASLGVGSGRAFSGVLGNDILRHYTIIGDVVNLVSRLMAATDDGILCDEQTMLASRSDIAFKSMLPVKLKGYDGPVGVWAPLRSEKGRAEVTLRPPMVGREEELQMLLRNLRKVTHGERASLILEAEAGVGKTRLLSDFRVEAEDSGMRVLISAGDRVERNVPYHGWRSIYNSLFEIETVSALEARRETVARQLGAELAERACLLNAVLPLGFVESEAIAALSGQQRAAATREMLVEVLRWKTAEEPLGVVIEDAHWLDDASWDLAYDIAASSEHVFLAISMRPMDDETRLRPLLKSGTQRLLLGGLTNAAQERLICAKLGVANLPKEVCSRQSVLLQRIDAVDGGMQRYRTCQWRMPREAGSRSA